MLRSFIPVTPDADTARAWAEEELKKPKYGVGADSESWLERAWRAITDWLGDLLDAVGSIGNVNLPFQAIVVTVLLALLAGAVWMFRPGRIPRSQRKSGKGFLDDDPRTAAEMRLDAEAAARSGDWPLAVLDRFRAIIRSMEERVIIDERAGRTAFEAARDGGKSLPDYADALVRGSHTFDDVCYGHGRASASDYDTMRELDLSITAAKPLEVAW